MGVIFSLSSLSFLQAMEMTEGNMINREATGTMMMQESASAKMGRTMQDGVLGENSVMATSKKSDIIKLQMILVTKGYLIMPKGVSYGYYGPRTKMAYNKYKVGMMMKSGTDTSMMKLNYAVMSH
jgi:hypothetical protein